MRRMKKMRRMEVVVIPMMMDKMMRYLPRLVMTIMSP